MGIQLCQLGAVRSLRATGRLRTGRIQIKVVWPIRITMYRFDAVSKHTMSGVAVNEPV